MTAVGAKNPAVQHLRRLTGRRSARSEANAFVVDGPVLVLEALDAGIEIEAAFVDEAAAAEARGTRSANPAGLGVVLERLEAADIRVIEVSAGVLAGAVDTVTPHGIAAIARPVTHPLRFVTSSPTGLVLVLAGVSDPGNAGTLLRSAEAAGAKAVVATAGSVDLFSPKTVRASAGALFHVPVVVGEPAVPALEALRAAGFTTWATVARDGEPYDTADLTGPVAIVLGSEAHGLTPEIDDAVDRHLTIPMAGRSESLNVAMAGTLVCFESARQRRSAHH